MRKERSVGTRPATGTPLIASWVGDQQAQVRFEPVTEQPQRCFIEAGHDYQESEHLREVVDDADALSKTPPGTLHEKGQR